MQCNSCPTMHNNQTHHLIMSPARQLIAKAKSDKQYHVYMFCKTNSGNIFPAGKYHSCTALAHSSSKVRLRSSLVRPHLNATNGKKIPDQEKAVGQSTFFQFNVNKKTDTVVSRHMYNPRMHPQPMPM